MPSPKTITVTADSAGQRLDIFLSDHLKISRSQAQKMIGEGQITVNDKPPKKSGDKLSAGARIKLASPSMKKTETKKSALPAPEAPMKKFAFADIDIVAQTPDYFVVNKPAGMLTHSTSRGETDSLAELLAKKYPALKKVGDDSARPGIVHRLDREASGLLVIARTPAMFEILKEQFKARAIDKEYLVLVHGRVAKDEDTIDFPIARGAGDRMSALPKTRGGAEHDEGKSALSEFLVEKRFINFTLLRVKIHTGRMHQIRVHMLAYDHPVAGDPMYFQKKRKRKWDEKLGRLFLHCSHLGFTDRAGEKKNFESPLPLTLKHFLTLLK